METQHIELNQDTPDGRATVRCLTQLKEGLQGLKDRIGIMDRMIDTEATGAERYAYIATQHGFESNEKAQAGYEELSSLAYKLTTNDQQVDVGNGLTQCFAKFG